MTGILRRAIRLAGLLGLLTSPLAAQSTLAAAAERARRAWQAQQPAELIGRTDRVTISMPGVVPSEALGAAQASAMFREVFAKATELETTIQQLTEVTPDEGSVELRRRFRPAGTQEVRRQVVLLAFRKRAGTWLLQEVRLLD